MARVVRLEGKGPIKIEPQDKPIWVCGCGLSANFPFCDGTHKICREEADGTLYAYRPDRSREERGPDAGTA